MNIILNLLQLRDILTDWETSATLNAARYQEARQPYSQHDAAFKKRIIPADLAKLISVADPQAAILFVQIKPVSAVILSMEDFQRWTTSPHYGVVWAASDYPKSLESRIANSTAWSQTKEEHFARQHEADRLVRMATTITKLLPPIKDLLAQLRGLPNEETVRNVIAVFESALRITIYEAPTTIATIPNETTDESPRCPSSIQPSNEEAPFGA